jgi:hypothetical protein
VQAASLSLQGGGQIASTAAGLGRGGDVVATIGGSVTIAGTASDGSFSGVTASATAGSQGAAGQVRLTAGGALSLSAGGQISSATAGWGNGGTVAVVSGGPLTVTGTGSGIVALASAAAAGNAGSVARSPPRCMPRSAMAGTS